VPLFMSDVTPRVRGSSCDVPLFMSDVHEPRIFRTDFRKIHIKFHENPSSGSRIVPCGQMDRHDEANSRFSQLY
jgi:hypothetical protein